MSFEIKYKLCEGNGRGLSKKVVSLQEGEDDSAAKVTFPSVPQESGAELERLLEEAEAVMRESNAVML